MTAQSLLLLAVLLALGSQLPAASGLRKGARLVPSFPAFPPTGHLPCLSVDFQAMEEEKSGTCPPDDGPCLFSVPDQCMDDSQCPARRKCCYQACFRQCTPRVLVKRGSCPQDALRCLSPTRHLCRRDADCTGSKRCCLGACGRDCRSPVTG